MLECIFRPSDRFELRANGVPLFVRGQPSNTHDYPLLIQQATAEYTPGELEEIKARLIHLICLHLCIEVDLETILADLRKRGTETDA